MWDDLKAVLTDLDGTGYPFQLDWFEPFREQRFPVLGQLQQGDIGIVMRQAHEPWPVLAEETTAAGVARFVDSANARVEVTCTGLSPSRYALLCNDRRVPLQETGVVDEAVGGVRFKAFNPPATLHPTRPAVNALVFDLVDMWTGKVVLGWTYFPPRPTVSGPAHPLPSIDAINPEGNVPGHRLAIPVVMPTWDASGVFFPTGSGVKGFLTPPPLIHDPRFPYLLDLARLD